MFIPLLVALYMGQVPAGGKPPRPGRDREAERGPTLSGISVP